MSKRVVKQSSSSKRARIDASDEEDVRFTETVDVASEMSYEALESQESSESDVEPGQQQNDGKQKTENPFRPPTTEEIHQLKETAELYKNNLFRLQIDELLNQVRVDHTRLSSLEKALRQLKSFLESAAEIPETNADNCVKRLKKNGVEFPLKHHLIKEHFDMAFVKPKSVSIVGSFLLQCVAKNPKGMNVDMAVEMDPIMFQERDYLNHRYHLKRAYFLSCLAIHLKKFPVKVSWKFVDHELSPILVLESQPGDLDYSKSKFTIKLIPSLSSEVFNPKRLAPHRNAVRSLGEVATPIYNNSILKDTVMTMHLNYLHGFVKACEGFRDASILGKVWIQQRNLDRFGLDGFLWEMLMAYLLTGGGKNGSKVLGTSFSSYQLVRVTIEWLAHHDFTKPLIMTEDGKAIEEFSSKSFENFEVALVDVSGKVNLAAHMTTSDLRWIQHVAKTSAKQFADTKIDHFVSLFMTLVDDVSLQFDYHFELPLEPRQVTKVTNLLTKGLGNRTRLVVAFPSHGTRSKWNLDEDAPSVKKGIKVGLLIDSEHAGRLVDNGPPADDVEKVKEFRSLWGSKAETRRFRDGGIREAVVWEAKDLADRSNVVLQAASYLLHRHFSLDVLKPEILAQKAVWGQLGEASAFQPVSDALTSFTRLVKSLNLPLSINSVLPNHPALSNTSILLPQKLDDGKTDPLDVVLQFESSGRWPDELRAIQQMKLAFYAEMVKQLNKVDDVKATLVTWNPIKRKPHATVSRACVEVVIPEGYLVRCRIRVDREEALFDRSLKNPNLSHDEQTQLILARDEVLLELYHRPRHVARIHELCVANPSLSFTIRLLKKWISSHMLWNHFSEELIELLAVGLFKNPAPFDSTQSGWIGFLRCLARLSDWKDVMVVELDGELTAEERDMVPSSIAPGPLSQALLISTDQDASGKMWKGPSALVMERVKHLAKASLKLGKSGELFSKMFVTPRNDFDALIHVKKSKDGHSKYRNLILADLETKTKGNVWHTNHLGSYVHLLESLYGDVALFFVDKMGSVIGVLWNPLALTNQPWKVSIPFSSRLDGTTAVPNVIGMLGEFERLGQGLVVGISSRD